jgi:intracellular sulfur oxidation DsrE/DsrF family protein
MKVTNAFLFLLLVVAFTFDEMIPTRPDPLAWAKPVVAVEKRGPEAQEELPKIIFLNQSAVLIASKKNREEYREHQARLIDMLNKGVTVLVCPDCMKQYGVKAADLIDGVQIGKPGQVHES